MAKRPKEVQAAINKGKKAWKEARNAKPGSSDFSAPKLKKYGSHKCKWDAKYGLNKNEELYASLIWTIVSGADKSKSHNLYFAIQNNDDSEKAEKAMARLAAAVQSLTGQDTSEADYEDPSSLFDLLDEIHAEKPIAMADIKENGEYLNVYIGDLVEDEDADEDEEEESDDDSEEEDEEEDEEEEEEKPKRGAKKAPAKSTAKPKTSKSKKVEEDEEDEEEEEEEEEDEEVQEPEKGDTVSFKPPRAKKAITCEVKSVNKRAQTCTLESEDGEKEFKSVAWDKLEY